MFNPLSHFLASNIESFLISPTDSIEVFSIFSSLNLDRIHEPKSIPTKILKLINKRLTYNRLFWNKINSYVHLNLDFDRNIQLVVL